MTIHEAAAWLAGVEDAEAISAVKVELAAPWARGQEAWVFLACAAALGASVLFYRRFQSCRGRRSRAVLAVLRGLVLVLLTLFLAEPVLDVSLVRQVRPVLGLLIDGSESMAIEDELSEAEHGKLLEAMQDELGPGKPRAGTGEARAAPRSRLDWVRALLCARNGELVGDLGRRFRLQAFIHDRAGGVRALELDDVETAVNRARKLADQLTAVGQTTALGSALADLLAHPAARGAAAVIVISDFALNSGPSVLEVASQLAVPLYTVGVGPRTALDISVELEAPLVLTSGERARVAITVRQSGFDGHRARVQLTAQRLGASATVDVAGSDAGGAAAEPLGAVDVVLDSAMVTAELSFVPRQAGRFRLAAEVAPEAGEKLSENNHAERECQVRDDFIRVLVVEYEPTWEWRSLKSVFHRDRLVGVRGFRTFLRSADPKVREHGDLFLTALSSSRSELFAYDVIILGDQPATALPARFAELLREFVGSFGGGLVVASGPRFGPAALAGSPLADLLPVVADPAAKPREGREFELRLTAEAALTDFMRLGSSPEERVAAWAGIGPLAWYQPVSRVHPLATVLAEHPVDRCADGSTPQPLIALRRYGRGEVVYLAFNETWRLRRKRGDSLYRQLWGQLIHRLAMNHALGGEKRFVVRSDRERYAVDDKALVTVEAYDADFKPVDALRLENQTLRGEVVVPAGAGSAQRNVPLELSMLRPGAFEARVSLPVAGEYSVRVEDPVTGQWSTLELTVARLSLERRSAVRNAALQRELAQSSGGKPYELAGALGLPADLAVLSRRSETQLIVLSLWSTWLSFALVVVLLLVEWSVRRALGMP